MILGILQKFKDSDESESEIAIAHAILEGNVENVAEK